MRRWNARHVLAAATLMLTSVGASRAEAGIVILRDGKVFVGKIEKEDVTDDSVKVHFPYKTSDGLTHQVGDGKESAIELSKKNIRWFDADLDEPSSAYWEKFADESLDAFWKQRWLESKRAPEPKPAPQPVTVELRSGERLEGKLIGMAGGVYTIQTKDGQRTLNESEVRKIDFGPEKQERSKNMPIVLPGKASPPINVQFEDADLREVLAQISKRVSYPIFLDSAVKEKVTVSLNQIPWRDAVEVIAHMCKCEVRDYGEGSLFLYQPPKVTIQFTNANIRVVLQLLSAYSGYSIILAPDFGADVTLDVKEVPWYTAMDVLTKSYHLHAKRRGSLIVVSKDDVPFGSDELEYVESGKWPVPTEAPSQKVDLEVEDADLRDACDQIGRLVRANILVDPAIQARATLSAKQVPWRDLVLQLAHQVGAEVRMRGPIVVLEPSPKFTLQASDAPIDVVFQLLAARAEKNLVLTSDVAGVATFDIKEVPFDDAITALAAAAKLPLSEDRGILKIGAGTQGPPKRIEPAARDVILGRRKLKLAVQALLVDHDPQGKSHAIVSGLIYTVGDRLRDESGGEGDVKIAAIKEGSIELENDDHARAVVELSGPR